MTRHPHYFKGDMCNACRAETPKLWEFLGAAIFGLLWTAALVALFLWASS